jgi:hypothetical protein
MLFPGSGADAGVIHAPLCLAQIDAQRALSSRAMAKTKIYEAKLVRDGSMCFIPVLFDPVSAFGRLRAPVKVTVGKHTYRSTIAAMGGTVCIPLRKSNREAAGLEGNERVKVKVVLDTDERVVTVPPDFAKALRKEKAWSAWKSLSFTHQKEHVEAIEDAKKPETRARRIAKSVAMIAAKPQGSKRAK